MKASLFIQSLRDTHLQCRKILAASFIYSTFFPLFLLPLWCAGIFFMWAYFYFMGGLFFPRSRPQAPCLTPLQLVVCIFEWILKSAACLLFPSLNILHLLSASFSRRSNTFNLLSCFPSSSVQCHWWRGTDVLLVGCHGGERKTFFQKRSNDVLLWQRVRDGEDNPFKSVSLKLQDPGGSEQEEGVSTVCLFRFAASFSYKLSYTTRSGSPQPTTHSWPKFLCILQLSVHRIFTVNTTASFEPAYL